MTCHHYVKASQGFPETSRGMYYQEIYFLWAPEIKNQEPEFHNDNQVMIHSKPSYESILSVKYFKTIWSKETNLLIKSLMQWKVEEEKLNYIRYYLLYTSLIPHFPSRSCICTYLRLVSSFSDLNFLDIREILKHTKTLKNFGVFHWVLPHLQLKIEGITKKSWGKKESLVSLYSLNKHKN